MKPKGWLRSLRRECWELVPWRRVHKFMSAQALTMGSTILGVLIAIGSSRATLLTVLGVTVVATLVGSLVKQPELEE